MYMLVTECQDLHPEIDYHNDDINRLLGEFLYCSYFTMKDIYIIVTFPKDATRILMQFCLW